MNVPLPRLFAADSVEIVLPIPSKSASFTDCNSFVAPSELNVEPETVFDSTVNALILSIPTEVSFDEPNSVGMLDVPALRLEDDVDVMT